MAFKDSFNKWEPIGGYGWEKTWRPLADDNFHVGLGYTAGVTARDNWNYIPIPVRCRWPQLVMALQRSR